MVLQYIFSLGFSLSVSFAAYHSPVGIPAATNASLACILCEVRYNAKDPDPEKGISRLSNKAGAIKLKNPLPSTVSTRLNIKSGFNF
jgi:hypothetical protein